MNFEDLMWLFSSNESSRGIVRLNIAEGALLYKYCKKKKDGGILEIGRKHGGSTVLMASALDKGKLYSVDIVDHSEAHDNTSELSNKIVLINGNSSEIEWDREIDLVFIDGDHSYDGVRKDIEKFIPFVKLNGYAIFHDVVTKKSNLNPLINELLDESWMKEDFIDSMLVVKRIR